MVFSNNLLLGAAGAGAGIDQSIRFNKNDDAKLTRTFGTATNRKIYTLSVWEKNGNSTGSLLEYNASGGVTWANITFGQDGRIDYFDYSGGFARIDLRTSSIYRDPSAWYHVVVAVDTTQATSTDRIKMYVNGVQITSFGTATYPSQNFEGFLNSSVLHLIGDGVNGPFDGYLAEYHFIDGQALDPTSFGEYNDDGVWVPIAYTNAAGYGSNGFYITGATASNLGKDFSGNNNDFTSSGLATTDQMLDTPMLNKATLNPLNLHTTGSVLSDGNLTVTNSGTSGFWRRAYATQSLSYKTYWEVHADNLGSLNMGVSSLSNVPGGVNNPAGNKAAGIQNNEAFVTGSYANESSGGRTFPISTGNYVMLAFDPARGALWMGTEGTWKDGTGSSASSSTILAEIEGSGTSYAIFTGIDADDAIPMIAQYSTSVATARFSSGDWEGTAPTGYEELSTAFIATPSITDGSAYMQTLAYASTGTSTAFVQDGNSQFEPGLVWEKSRTGANNHLWFDQVRGATKFILSDTAAVENTVADTLTSFNSNGFTAGADSANWGINYPGRNNVAWMWKANGAGSSNTDGSVTSTVSNNSTSSFSVVKYTGTGSGSSTVGHGLGVTPDMIIVKHLDRTQNWRVFHTSVGVGSTLFLNNTSAASTDPDRITAVSSTTFTAAANMNESADYVAYCFAEIPGYSSIGSYEGNGSTDGTFVYTGFKPSFILTKNIDTTDQWGIRDAARNPFNVTDKLLNPNSHTAETSSSTGYIDILSNGFKPRSSDSSINTQTIIYMAFAEHPFGGNGVAPATAR
jgi:hypothetical protein